MRRVAFYVAFTLALSACSPGPTLLTREVGPLGEGRFHGRALLVLSDVDMPGTAYADGILTPRLQGEIDALSVISEIAQPGARIAAPNSVMGWPGAMDISPDGRFAYVVETRGTPAANLERLQGGVNRDMPQGAWLTAIDLASPAAPALTGRLNIGGSPNSIHISPDGRFALIGRGTRHDSLLFVSLIDGAPQSATPIRLDLPDLARRPDDEGVNFVRLAPNGRDFVLNVANTHLVFARLEVDAQGRFVSARMIGAPMQIGRWLTIARWSLDGRHVIVSDVGWSASQFGAVLNGPGALFSVRFDPQGAHRAVSEARVSLSPEGFDMSRDGSLLAVVNMERTYLPERLPYQLFGRRDRSSLSLVGFNTQSGALRMLDGPIAFEGVLPEDAVFDADGDMIAVAVFHDKTAEPRTGHVAYFHVVQTANGPRLTPTNARTPTPRGAHDLILLP